MENLINEALTQSIWASLSIALIFYILKKQETRDLRQETREANYHKIISDLTKELHTIEEVRNDIHELKLATKKNN